MSFTMSIAFLPLLWLCVTAIPAGQDRRPNDTHPEFVGGHYGAGSYGLLDQYDGTNWLNMFDVQSVSNHIHRQHRRLTQTDS